MAQFTDTLGRQWNVDLTIGTARRLKAAGVVDLLSDESGKLIESLIGDVGKLLDVIWTCVHDQAATLGVDQDAFWDAIDGDVIDQATEALLEALVNFTRPSRRPALRAVLSRMRAAETKMATRMTEWAETGRLDQQIDQAIEQAIEQAERSLGSDSKNSPATSEATSIS